MPVKTQYDPAKGIVTTRDDSGFEVIRTSGNKGFAPFHVYDTVALTAITTMSLNQAGVITVSGTNGIVPILMPSASLCPGSFWTFINKSVDSHYLSGSQYGVKSFNNGTSAGTRLQLANVIDQSVTLMSDVVLGQTSSSITIAGN